MNITRLQSVKEFSYFPYIILIFFVLYIFCLVFANDEYYLIYAYVVIHIC